jgi:hypothetical protein
MHRHAADGVDDDRSVTVEYDDFVACVADPGD